METKIVIKKTIKKKVIKKNIDTNSNNNINEFISININSVEKLQKLLENQMLPSFDIDVKPKEWVLPTRIKFNTWLESTFKYPSLKTKQKCEACNVSDVSDKTICPTVKIDSVNLFPHQSFIKDYMQFSSPYRGILLYHGLGVGKTCASIAAAELLMNHMDIVVMLPAALKGNYINEIKKCGRRFYNLKQYWTFVPLSVFEKNQDIILDLLKLDNIILNKNEGIWVPENLDLNPNYNILPSFARNQIIEQTDNIIKNKFSFINYNGLKTINIKELIKDGNPFDNKCVVIDEIHNMISRIVNKGKIGTALYKLLYTAKNCKLIMLSGTPIINYPYEISYLINLIIGPKIYNILSIAKKTNFDADLIKEILNKIYNIDTFTIDENTQKITIALLPYGFSYTNKQSLGIKRLTDKNIKTDEEVINFVIKEFKKNNIIINKKTATKEYKILPEDENDFNKYFVDMDAGKIINQRLFSRRILGAVSYYSKYSPDLYPSLEIEETNEVMTDFQFHQYEKSRLKEREKEKNSKFNKGTGGNIFKSTGQVYRFYSRANCNFVFPDEIKRPFPSMAYIKNEIDDDDDALNIIEKIIEKNEDEASNNDKKDYEKALKMALDKLASSPENYLDMKNLNKYSPKLTKIIERIIELKGTSLVYSQFRKVEGLGILGLALQANGFCELKIKKIKDEWDIDINEDDYKKPKYVVFTGNNEETQILLKIFNSDIDNIPIKIKNKLSLLSYDSNLNNNNIKGSIVKVMMITQSGAEGISLKNVREVHIMEPYWNYIRIDQVVGRAVRTCSHVELPKEDRNVKVYIYNMAFKPEQLASSFTIKAQDNSLTSDQYIYSMAVKKAKIINILLELVKKASIDCALNAKSHSNMRCFSFPTNLDPMDTTYKINIEDELFDIQYQKNVEMTEWKGEVLITKKGNFLIKPNTNEVYDYDLYLESGKLIKIGILRIVDNKKTIVKIGI